MDTNGTAKHIVELMDKLASLLEDKYIPIFETDERRHYFWTKRKTLEIFSVAGEREIPLYEPIPFEKLESYFRRSHPKPNKDYLNPRGLARGGSNQRITKKGYFSIVIASLEAAIDSVSA